VKPKPPRRPDPHGPQGPKVASAPARVPAARVPTLAPGDRWIVVGQVMGTHGVRGDLRVKMHNPDSELLFDLGELCLRLEGNLSAHRMRSAKPVDKGWLVRLEGTDSVEAARTLQRAEICVPRSALPEPEEGEFYLTDLEGLLAVKPDGSEVGRVLGVLEYPAADVLRIQVEGGTLEVPLAEPYLVAVDLKAGQVVVDELDELEIEKPRR
jgi:16S rRNA processing protein RimM